MAELVGLTIMVTIFVAFSSPLWLQLFLLLGGVSIAVILIRPESMAVTPGRIHVRHGWLVRTIPIRDLIYLRAVQAAKGSPNVIGASKDFTFGPIAIDGSSAELRRHLGNEVKSVRPDLLLDDLTRSALLAGED